MNQTTRPTTILVDRYGQDWRPANTYQDHTHDAPGWLLLTSVTSGEERTYADVLDLYGFRDEQLMRNGEMVPYLIGYIDAVPTE